MGSNAPMLASTGTCVVLVGKVDDSAYADLRATAMLRHWHAFFAGIDACKPEQAYLAGRDTAHFEYVLPADTFTTCQPQQSSDAAVEAMSRFAMDVLQYSNKVGVPVRLGMDVNDCTTGFTGTTLRFGVFGGAVVAARHAASMAGSSELVVTDNVAAQCSFPMAPVCKGLHSVIAASNPPTHRLPTPECHPTWLWFLNPALERRFAHHLNRICMVPELFWMALGLLSVFAYARGSDAGPPALSLASVLWVVVEAITLALYTLCRTQYLRHREAWAVLMRVSICIAICAFSYKLGGPQQLMLGYGTTAMVMNALGHKVRFHVQLAVSAFTTAVALAWMSFDHWTGAVTVPVMLPVLHVMLAFVAPAVLMFQVDRTARLGFLQTNK